MHNKVILTNLLLVFFQRTTFIDLPKIGDYIEKNITNFQPDKGQKQIIAQPPVPIEDFPRIQIKSACHKYIITLFNNRLDLSLIGVYNDDTYDRELEDFISIGFQLSGLVASEDNICGRIGVVNDTFFITHNAINDIIKRFCNAKAFNSLSQLILNYTEKTQIAEYDTNIMDTVQPGELKIENEYPGIIVRRDVNIANQQRTIEKDKISEFLSASISLISRNAMEKIIYE